MSELYKVKAPWYCNAIKTKVNHYKERRPYIDVKYCSKCQTTWEYNYGGSLIHYRHLPTYGLDRVECQECEQ
jgi:hypothetical protein